MSLDCNIDLDKMRVGDIAVGDTLSTSRHFAVSSFPDSGDACFPEAGIMFCVGRQDRIIISALISFCEDLPWRRTPLKPFSGAIIREHQEIKITMNTTEEEIRRLFGNPLFRAVSDEISVFHELPPFSHELVFSFLEAVGGGQSLTSMTINSPPLLQSADERKFYGFIGEWPPEVP